jgi:hypothetical protein
MLCYGNSYQTYMVMDRYRRDQGTENEAEFCGKEVVG